MKRAHLSIGMLAGAVMLVGLSGCGLRDSGDDTADPTLTTKPPVTTDSQQSTTSTTTKSTTEKPTPSSSSTTAVAPTKAVAEGSGCSPGSGQLPDGTWYGYVVDTETDGFEFDLACFFQGKAAALAATEDGAESPPPNDYYIRNANKEIRTVRVGSNGQVTWYPDFGDPASKATTTYDDWARAIADRGFVTGVWIKVGNGQVSTIDEQWVP